MATVRIGLLGAARIAPLAVIRPARTLPEVVVDAVAARDPQRAHAFARRYAIPRVRESYGALVADPALDAVYIATPNSLHCEWAIRALEAGKHVLCEKPFAANAAQAERMAAVAARTGGLLMEAFHYRYHPLAQRLQAILRSGELGPIRHIEVWMQIPLLNPRDIRYRYDLAGGATMDAGCYAIHLLRFLAAQEPTVMRARARLIAPRVDRWMQAEVAFANGLTGRLTCSLLAHPLLRIGARVQGEQGEMRVVNFVLPQLFHRLSVRTMQGTRTQQLTRVPTYTYQLRAFVDSVLQQAPNLTPPDDAVATMRVIDAVYEAAGLPRRGT